MPELGKYANAVLTSWGATLVLIAVIVAMSVVSARRSKRRLDETEARVKGKKA